MPISLHLSIPTSLSDLYSLDWTSAFLFATSTSTVLALLLVGPERAMPSANEKGKKGKKQAGDKVEPQWW